MKQRWQIHNQNWEFSFSSPDGWSYEHIPYKSDTSLGKFAQDMWGFSIKWSSKLTWTTESEMCWGQVNTTNKFHVGYPNKFHVGYQIRKDGTICKQVITKTFQKLNIVNIFTDLRNPRCVEVKSTPPTNSMCDIPTNSMWDIKYKNMELFVTIDYENVPKTQ